MKKKLYFIVFLIVSITLYYIFDNDKFNYKVVEYNGTNLKISIDGNSSSKLPESGFYHLVDYNCKSSNTKIEWDKDNYKLNVTNSNKEAGVVCYLEFKSYPLLSEMPVGSYVQYIGNNGCEGIHCAGNNANYESDEMMGYCYNDKYPFLFNGWRIGYIEDDSAVLISAGAPECMGSCSDGNTVNSGYCRTYLDASNIYKHFDNMNKIALKYCNSNYIKNGSCNEGVIDDGIVNVIDANVFFRITGGILNEDLCSGSSSKLCGYSNDLIANGGIYWYKGISPYEPKFIFLQDRATITSVISRVTYGVRPVLSLDSSVIVTSGDGTYESPYLIDNNYFVVGDGSGILNSNNDLSNVSLSLNSVVEVSKMCISVDTSSCSNYIDYSDTYSLDLSNAGTGEKIIYVYYKDAYNKIVAAMQRTVVINNES